MGLDAAAQEILPVWQGVVIFLEPHQTAVAAELAQGVDDRLQIVALETGAALQLRRGEAGARLFVEQGEDFLLGVAGHGCCASFYRNQREFNRRRVNFSRLS